MTEADQKTLWWGWVFTVILAGVLWVGNILILAMAIILSVLEKTQR